MITINKNSKIFIWALDPNVKSGGAAVCNMLASYLNSLGVNAKLFNWGVSLYEQNDVYKEKYPAIGGSWEEVIDDENTVLIFPEYFFIDINFEDNGLFKIHAPFIKTHFKHAQIIIWWLSTGDDNRHNNIRRTLDAMKFDNVLHMCESHTVLNDLEHFGIHDVVYLEHGVDSIFYKENANINKNNYVFYGLKYECQEYVENEIIPRINVRRPDIVFKTLKNEYKSPNELCDLYDECKIYIDFAYFSGREMMPREATLRNNIIILNNRNVCTPNFDYPIKSEYKVDRDDPDKICDLIVDCIDNYDERIKDFTYFKNKCLYEPIMFKSQIYSIFGPAIKKTF
jgi:hypothetical protein